MKAIRSSRAPAKAPKTPKVEAKKRNGSPPARVAPVGRAAPPRGKQPGATRLREVDPSLFEAMSEGERADALRILTEDRRLASMAKVARYRVIAVEPLVVKPPHPQFGRRTARIVVYDYASDRSVEAAVDLDGSAVIHLQIGSSQPMLSRDEEATAVAIALGDDRLKRELALGDQPLAVMHYWSKRDTDLAHSRRSAAVLLGQPGARPAMVAVVDLLGAQVVEIVPAAQW
jgi:hypothetical protein